MVPTPRTLIQSNLSVAGGGVPNTSPAIGAAVSHEPPAVWWSLPAASKSTRWWAQRMGQSTRQPSLTPSPRRRSAVRSPAQVAHRYVSS